MDNDQLVEPSSVVDLVVVGLGYVGLPLAHRATEAGLSVLGFDVNGDVVDGLNSGVSHIDDLDDAEMGFMLEAGFKATTDPNVLRATTAAAICVPTPLAASGGPDLSAVRAACATIGDHVKANTLVVLESTTYPGTTAEVVGPALEERSGLRVGDDLFLAFSPERIDPGNAEFGVANTPKVVGADDPLSLKRATELYGVMVGEVVEAKGTREAEAAKLLENTYRHVNIALVNEMSQVFHALEVDVWDVIRLAATKPFGFAPFYPGPGVGGHCIPIDPNYLSHHVRSQLGFGFRIIELSQEINQMMPAYIARRVQSLLNDEGRPVRGSKVLLLGTTYKPDIADQRESPSSAVASELASLGAELYYHDPHVLQWLHGVTRVEDPYASAGDMDLCVLLVNHKRYDVPALVSASRLFFDTRGATEGDDAIRL